MVEHVEKSKAVINDHIHFSFKERRKIWLKKAKLKNPASSAQKQPSA